METASRRVLVIDAANVVGSRPDGWWRDRAGAATRLLGRIADAAAGAPELSGAVVVVLEGRANDATAPEGATLEVVRAPRDGDAAIAEIAHARRGDDVVVVTSDRGLRARVEASGATVRGAGWLLDALDRAEPLSP